MTAPNIASITASLERSLQTFSLNHHTTTSGNDEGEESTNTHCNRSINSSNTTLDLNSNMSLPYHWEQCLDLKTGEMYYINWRTGMKSNEHPGTFDDGLSGYIYSDEEEEEDEDEDGDEEEEEEGSLYADSESSSAAASTSGKPKRDEDEDEEESRRGEHVLVVAGCKGCFMYFMVPKQVDDCPKCCGQLLHFDRSDDH